MRDIYHAKVFHFQDDVFTLNSKWTIDFCREYSLKVGLPFEVQLRVNLVDEEIIKSLKSAGCVLAMYGIESGNKHMRVYILNRNISDEMILNTAALFEKYGIRTMSVNILGLPDESVSMAIETLKLNIKCKPDYAWNSIYHPYPMTKLAEYSISQGYFDGDLNKFNGSFIFGKCSMKTKEIRKIVRLHYLFPVVVEFPFLLGICRLMINLPFVFIYRLIFSIHRAYAAIFKLKRIKIAEVVILEKSKLTRVARHW